MIYITRKLEFCASHRLYNPEYSDEKNAEVFGLCNNPNGHGHNYVLEVTVRGEVHPETGMVLDRINFDLAPGAAVAVVGPNGAGKTTLFKVIAGILDPGEGIVQVSGHEPGGHTCIAYVPQSSTVNWTFPATVADVVMMGRINKMGPFLWPQKEDWAVVQRSLAFVNLSAYAKRQISELDAYNALALLVRYEDDLRAQWTNRLGQRLNTQLLLDNTWDHYLVPRSADEEFADHSYLHLVEILLAYNSRLGAGERRDPNSLKQRLLSVELERREFGGYDASEALGHYVESLGFLLAESDVAWSKAEKAKVLEWLRELETVRFREIDGVPLQHLSHLLLGLRSVESNAARLH